MLLFIISVYMYMKAGWLCCSSFILSFYRNQGQARYTIRTQC